MSKKDIFKKFVITIFISIVCLFILLYTTDAINMIFVHPFEYWGSEPFSDCWYYKSATHYGLRAVLDVIICLICLYCVLKYHRKHFGRIAILILCYLLWTFKYPIKIWIKHLFF